MSLDTLTWATLDVVALDVDPGLAAEAAAIVAMDQLHQFYDPDGIGRALLARHQANAVDAEEHRLNVLTWRNYWTADRRERLRWLGAVDGMTE